MALPLTYLQGAFRAPDGFAVRLTLDPLGTPTLYNVVFQPGEELPSVSAILTLFSVTTGWTFTVNPTDYEGTITVTTPGAKAYSINWSLTGDGTALATFLGNPSNITAKASGTPWAGPHLAGFYPPIAAQRLTETERRVDRAQIDLLDGNANTQHTRDSTERDISSVDLVLWVADYTTGLRAFENFLDHLEDYCPSGLFTARGPAGARLVQWDSTEVRITAQPSTTLPDGRTLWEIRCPTLTTETPRTTR